jgi:CRISPR system Cascade subunit CasE
MVYLSEVTLDPRRRTALKLLGDSYGMHRFLLMGFPDGDREAMGRMLYRAESRREAIRVLVQSEIRPDWSRLEAEAKSIRGPKETPLFRPDGSPIFQAGQTLRFRLRANPTAKRAEKKRRALLTRDEQCEWLARKGVQHGFELIPVPNDPAWFDPFEEEPECRMEVRIIKLDRMIGRKQAESGENMQIEHFGVDFDGSLRVTDPRLFAEAIRKGVGPAKGFGFGLLSVAPMNRTAEA